MTLQQKLLAKQSKKGFTLVELVVVIAILGILAAIAIPAVIGIISSANESQAKSDASSVNTACKNLYAEVVAGTVNASNKGSLTSAVTLATITGYNATTTAADCDSTNLGLPKANAAASSRKHAALSLTVKHALEYAGLTNLSNKLSDFCYDAAGDGTIYAKVDNSKPTNSPGTTTAATYSDVADTTTMSDLNYK